MRRVTCVAPGKIRAQRLAPRPDIFRVGRRTARPYGSLVRELLAAAQRVDVDRQRLDRHRVQTALPGRHDAGEGCPQCATNAFAKEGRGFIGKKPPNAEIMGRRSDLHSSI